MVAFYFTPLLIGFLLAPHGATVAPAGPRAAPRGRAGACVWVPVVFESGYVQLERSLQGNLNYSHHLLTPGQLLDSTWGYGAAKSFGLGWGHLLVAAFAWFGLRERGWLRFFTAAAVVFCLLTLQPMAWVWEAAAGPAANPVSVAPPRSGRPLPRRAGSRRGARDGTPGALALAGFRAAMALLIVPGLAHLAPPRLPGHGPPLVDAGLSGAIRF